MNLIQQLIIEAVSNSNSNQLRNEAQATLFNLFSQNPTQFFQNCTFLITDSSRVDINRQAVATVMKAMLQKKTDKNQFFWDLVEQNRRPSIKTSLFDNLVSEKEIVMRAGANVIAGIAAIENSRGQWLDLIHMLAANTRHQSQNIRIASLTTLGYICEELKNTRTCFTQSVCEQILGGIINGLRQNEQIAYISLQALRDSVHFLTSALQNYSYMDETFKALYGLLSHDLGNKAYEVLFEMGKICYLLLSPFLQSLCQITIQHIKSRSVLSQKAMQFWDTVATEYLIRNQRNASASYTFKNPVPNYMMQIQSLLVPQIMSCMLIVNDFDLEHPQLREASVRSLTSIVGCCGRQAIDLIVKGVENIIDSSQDGHRQASVLLFSCLSEHKDTRQVKSIFQKWFQKLFSLTNDSSEIVRKNTLNGLIGLSLSFPQVFIQREDFNAIFQTFLLLCQDNDEDISVLSLQILFNITQYFDYNRGKNKPFVKSQLHIQLLLSKFFDENSHKKIKYLQMIVEITINMLILITDLYSQAELLKYLINKYYTIDHKKAFIITNTLQLIYSLLLRIRGNQYVINQIIHTINLFIHHLFQTIGCNISVFQVLGAFCMFIENRFSLVSLDQNYWKYTEQGLSSYEDTKLFTATILCLSDVVRYCNGKYASKIITITKRLIGFINPNISYNHKYLILRYFGDFCIGLGEYVETLLDKILTICTQCFNAIYILQQSEDQRDSADELKYAVIDLYQSMTWSIHKKGKLNLKLANHFETLSTFIVLTCQQRLNPQLEYLRQSIMVLFDHTLIYLMNKNIGPIARKIIYSEEVKMIIETLKLHSNRQKIQDTLQFVAEVYSKFP